MKSPFQTVCILLMAHIKMGCALDRPDCGELSLCMFNKHRAGFFGGADDTFVYSLFNYK